LSGIAFSCNQPELELAKRSATPNSSALGARPGHTSSSDRHSLVSYRVPRETTLQRVANLYKLSYDEVFALNPTFNHDALLPAGADVMVYREPTALSESVGLPYDGSISASMPMLDGAGRRLTSERWKMWGSRSTVLALDRVLSRWAELQPEGPEVLVGNLSTRRGGSLKPHKSHQSGRDVDLSYVMKWDGNGQIRWQPMDVKQLDTALTWKLLRLIEREAEVEVFFVDREVQLMLLRAAQRDGRTSSAQLQHWLEVAPGANRNNALIRHVSGHRDHFHVRFRCSNREARCKS
jgi:murein endopeptidase